MHTMDDYFAGIPAAVRFYQKELADQERNSTAFAPPTIHESLDRNRRDFEARLAWRNRNA